MTVYLRVLWYTAEILPSQLDNERCDDVPEVLKGRHTVMRTLTHISVWVDSLQSAFSEVVLPSGEVLSATAGVREMFATR